MFFQTAGIEVSLWIPPLIAFVISFFTSMGGISGAFLLLPFQMSFLGYTNPSVSATNQLFNVVAIPSGVFRYYREGRMVWPLTWVVVAGTLPGVLIGAFVRIEFLPDPGTFKIFAAFVLMYIGMKMLRDLLKKKDADSSDNNKGKKYFKDTACKNSAKANTLPSVRITHFSLKRFGYIFYGEQFDVPFWGVFALSLLVGIVGGIYGIGGGAIVAPFFITVFGLPVHTVAGAALMGTFVTSMAGVAFYQAIAPMYPNMSVAPDYFLGVLFGLGGAAGMYLGARCQKFVPSGTIKWMLVGTILFTAIKYAIEFFGY